MHLITGDSLIKHDFNNTTTMPSLMNTSISNRTTDWNLNINNGGVASELDDTQRLHILLYSTYPDMAILDWLISLEEMDRMDKCSLTYGQTSLNNIKDFTPSSRMLQLNDLNSNSSYHLILKCLDRVGHLFASNILRFNTTTGVVPLPILAAAYYLLLCTW